MGFSFLKVKGERNNISIKGNIEINHNISIIDVKQVEMTSGNSKNEVLKVEFKFDVVYGQSLGNLELIGDVVYKDTDEIIMETKKMWDSEKKLPQIVNQEILKFVYAKSIVRSLELADSINLPIPVPLPQIEFKNNS